MKNKKLIATVASLCLVLVAVVAAVIGVLAAAQQTFTNNVKVNYYAAANVYAQVSLNGRSEQGVYGSEVSHLFKSADKQQEENLKFQYEGKGLGLSESEAGTNKYALYRFTFENKNPTYDLDVTMTYSGSEGTNTRLFWVKSNSSSWAPELTYNDAGALQTTHPLTAVGITLTQGTAKVYHHENTSANPIAAANDTDSDIQYIYLVVAVVNLNSDAGFDLDGTTNKLTFTLDGYRAPAPANP